MQWIYYIYIIYKYIYINIVFIYVWYCVPIFGSYLVIYRIIMEYYIHEIGLSHKKKWKKKNYIYRVKYFKLSV